MMDYKVGEKVFLTLAKNPGKQYPSVITKVEETHAVVHIPGNYSDVVVGNVRVYPEGDGVLLSKELFPNRDLAEEASK